MAKDLIPPPSPAGKARHPGSGPEPDTQRPPFGELPPLPAAAEAIAEDAGIEHATRPAREPRPKLPADSPYLPRFRFLLGGLIGVGLAVAVIVALTIADGGVPEPAPEPAWSEWRPASKEALTAAKEIADHVGPQYRLANGDQLVAVRASGLEVANIPLTVAVRTALRGGDIRLVEGNGVLYTLNGLGANGSIAKGKPSVSRHLLLRREALELALYTFRYIDGVDLVVVLLPPRPPEKDAATATPSPTATPAPNTEIPPTQAVLYRPGDLSTPLDIPLPYTIDADTPRAETFKGPEATKIDELTLEHTFTASFRPSQDARAYLVLDPLPAE